MALKIGMFDSGIGGLSTLKNLLCQRADLEIYYWADDAYAPYGSKSEAEVRGRCHAICQHFIHQGIGLIVIACNTATALAIDELRAHYPEITFVGVEPYVNVVNHLPWQAQQRAVILTTPLTGQSARFSRLKRQLDPAGRLDQYSCPQLAKIVEHAFWQGDPQLAEKIQEELAPLQDQHYTYAILGCTHYPLVGRYIAATLNTEVISTCSAVSKRVLDLLDLAPCNPPETPISFWFTRSSQNTGYAVKTLIAQAPWPAL